MPELMNARIDQLPQSAGPRPKSYFPMWNDGNGVTERIEVENFMVSTMSQNFEWITDNDPGYAINEVVTRGGKWYQSLINDNLNNIPGQDPTKWVEIARSPSGFVLWKAGVYTDDNNFVLRVIDGFVQLAKLTVAAPFVSSNFEQEFAEGTWELASERGYHAIQKNAHGFAVNDTLTFKTGAWNKFTTGDTPLAVVRQVVSPNLVIMLLLGNRVKNLSGLTPGVKYYAQSNATIATTDTGVPIWFAISATEAILIPFAGATPSIPVPVNSVAPLLTDFDSYIVTTNGTWTNSPTSYSYQWKRDGVNVPGGGNMYLKTADDFGTDITCEVIAINGGGNSIPELSSNMIAVDMDPDYAILNARYDVQPNEHIVFVEDMFVRRLKALGIFSELDALYIVESNSHNNAKQNWKSNTANLTENGTLSFTPNVGSSSLGTGHYETNLVPGAGNFALNDASYGHFFVSDGSNAMGFMGNGPSNILCASNLSAVLSSVNSGSFATTPPQIGFNGKLCYLSADRDNNTQIKNNVNGSLRNTLAQASSGMGAGEFLLMAFDNGGAFRQSSGTITKGGWIGSGSFDQEVLQREISLFLLRRKIRGNVSGSVNYLAN